MKYKDKEFLENELINNGKSINKLSKEINISRQVIYKYIDNLGLKDSYIEKRCEIKKIYEFNKKNKVAQKKYYEIKKLKGENKSINTLSTITFNEFTKIRDSLGLTNEIFMVELLQKFKGKL